MAAPAAVVAAKAAIEVARNKKLRNAVITVLCIGLFLLIMPVIMIASIAESGAEIDYGSPEIRAALAAAMTDGQKGKAAYIDDAMQKLQTEAQAQVPGVDFIKIQVFYLCILYGQEGESESFYEDFIGCFKDAEDDDAVFGNIEEAFGVTITEKDRQDVLNLYAAAKDSGGALAGSDAEKLLKIAEGLLGKPYRWGGTGPDAFDCSGFVWYCFEEALGKAVPRTADAQQSACKAVKKARRRPGDLIFFQDTYKAGVSHVGIYIGDNTMIHAPGSGDVVKYSKVTDSYYMRHFHSYGRVK